MKDEDDDYDTKDNVRLTTVNEDESGDAVNNMQQQQLNGLLSECIILLRSVIMLVVYCCYERCGDNLTLVTFFRVVRQI